MNRYEALNSDQSVSETDPFTEERYRQFFRHIPDSSKDVLDVGCNTGRGGRVLKDLNGALSIAGLDAVRDRLDRLPSAVYSTTVHGLSTAIPVPDESYDIVVAGEFLEHLYPRDVESTLDEVFRILRIGGRFLLTTPNPSDIKRIVRRQSILGGAHLTQHHVGTLAFRLRMVGFSRIRVRGSGKMTRYLGERFPMALYGSYLMTADKF